MIERLTSIVIPTYNHAAFIRDAIASAAAQTAPVEIIVVDDGSTDETLELLERWSGYIRLIHIPHGGPAVARNAGIDAAAGEFVMFLDADDELLPTKVEREVAAFDACVGWVFCDVRIEEATRGRVTTASDRYRYAQRNLGGWIREQLAPGNFIPVMAPLVRRDLLTADVRFPDRELEDWHFWYRLAAHARVRYVPEVLAVYKKRRNGRNAQPKGIRIEPWEEDVLGPVVLNLGCGTPGAASWHPIPGAHNLDKSLGWCFEDGLPQFGASTVDGITISHALMYLEGEDWSTFLADCFRVLKPWGVLRITEDDAHNPQSARRGGWHGSEPAITLTSPKFVRAQLEAAGFTVYDVAADQTLFPFHTLLQAQHGTPPDVFFIEGQKRS